MTKELQDLAWSLLPKEFKEEVRTIYAATLRMVDKREDAEQIYVNKLSTLEGIFGFHNLTSDAEGEEMLTISRKKVTQRYTDIVKDIDSNISNSEEYFFNGELAILKNLFGSKCLPDEDNFASKEPKPAEPSEPSRNLSQEIANCDKYLIGDATEMINGIIKDGFRDHNRLHIATQITASIYSCAEVAQQFKSIEAIVRKALDIADTLISECGKGGE